MKLASPKSAGWAGRLPIQESQCSSSSPKAVFCRTIKSHVADEIWKQSAREFSLLGRASLFVLVKPSPDWLRPTHIMENNLFYSKSANLSMRLIQKYSHRNTQNMVCTTYLGTNLSWHGKLTITNCFYVYPIVFDPIFWEFFFGNSLFPVLPLQRNVVIFFSTKKEICISSF